MKSFNKMAMAAAAAALFSGAIAPVVHAEEGQVKCQGINSCKGTSKCATSTNACAGQNSCKGQGWIMTTAEECKKQAGTVKND